MKSQFIQTVHNYQNAFLEALTVGKFNATMVDDALQPMVEGLDEQKDVVHLLMMLERDDVNNYTHSIQVGLLSFYLANWLGYSQKRVIRLVAVVICMTLESAKSPTGFGTKQNR